MKTVKFYTLGCKANQYDTQSIRERFMQKGYIDPENGATASICVINTCTVTAQADSKSKYMIRHAIRENPRAKIIVTGCMAEKDFLYLSGINGITYLISKRFFPDKISSFSKHIRAFLKIQDGCDNLCSYCKVAVVRGRSRSKPPADIIAEARELVNNGHKEIVLTGICLGDYGNDLKPKSSLGEIINMLQKIDGLLRIRLSSIEAGDVSGKLIKIMAKSSKLCRHFHIPIQSGDNKILKKMNRKYTAGTYFKLISRIKRLVPGVSITTDILVGFPGEKNKNFANTLELIKKIRPLGVHIFPYSDRNFTKASSFDGKVPVEIIKGRIKKCKNAALKHTDSSKKKFLGKVLPVLIEQPCKCQEGYWEGLTDNYLNVRVKSNLNLQNRIISVKLNKLQGDYFLGMIT